LKLLEGRKGAGSKLPAKQRHAVMNNTSANGVIGAYNSGMDIDSLSLDSSSIDDTLSVISTPSDVAGSEFSGADSDLGSDVDSMLSEVDSLNLGLDLEGLDTDLTAEVGGLETFNDFTHEYFGFTSPTLPIGIAKKCTGGN
jgi:hypothetical protein